jgi:hypothetical protein
MRFLLLCVTAMASASFGLASTVWFGPATGPGRFDGCGLAVGDVDTSGLFFTNTLDGFTLSGIVTLTTTSFTGQSGCSVQFLSTRSFYYFTGDVVSANSRLTGNATSSGFLSFIGAWVESYIDIDPGPSVFALTGAIYDGPFDTGLVSGPGYGPTLAPGLGTLVQYFGISLGGTAGASGSVTVNLGSSAQSEAITVGSVPEPSTSAAFLSGLAVLWAIRNRARRRT